MSNGPNTLTTGRSSSMVLPGDFFFNVQLMDNTIAALGVNIFWRKSHICPCAGSTGSGNPSCLQCGGYGRYWDAPPAEPFIGAISFMLPDDPASRVAGEAGSYANGMPILSIPQGAGSVWDQAATYDLFELSDALQRFTINLVNGQNNTLPYTYGLEIPPTGAVTYFDTATNTVSADNNYTVQTSATGIVTVTLTDQPVGTPFSVEYFANQAYVAFLRGGVPHVRPEVQGFRLPKRFQLQTLDVWLRAHGNVGNP